MTRDEEILLKQLDENPEDDTLRLVLADAVQERDEELATLIRVGVRCHCVRERYAGVPFAGIFGADACSSCSGRQWLRRCEHEGCREGGFGCFLPKWEDDATDQADGFYCGAHAPEHGFCARCGGFHAGIESFDTSASGMCGECQSDADDESDEHYRDDDYYDGEEYPDEF